MYLFTCLLNSSKTNYKLSSSKKTNKTNIGLYRQTETEQRNMYHLDNKHSNGAIIPTMIQ
jgi:hypothetical protein